MHLIQSQDGYLESYQGIEYVHHVLSYFSRVFCPRQQKKWMNLKKGKERETLRYQLIVHSYLTRESKQLLSQNWIIKNFKAWEILRMLAINSQELDFWIIAWLSRYKIGTSKFWNTWLITACNHYLIISKGYHWLRNLIWCPLNLLKEGSVSKKKKPSRHVDLSWQC